MSPGGTLRRARTGFPRQHEVVKADLAGKLVKMPMCAHSLNFVSTQSECRVETCPSAGNVQRLRVCLACQRFCVQCTCGTARESPLGALHCNLQRWVRCGASTTSISKATFTGILCVVVFTLCRLRGPSTLDAASLFTCSRAVAHTSSWVVQPGSAS